jgi:ribosomal protein L29
MSDLTNKTEKDLQKDIATKRVAVRTFRFGSSGSKTRNVKEAKGLKKDIARMLTELNSRKA